MDGYDKLNFIDKIRFKWRVRQQEKIEDKRQALEHDDRIPVDKQSIINELLTERYNKKNKVKFLPINENNLESSNTSKQNMEKPNTLKQYTVPKDTIINYSVLLEQKRLDQMLEKQITNEIDAYENIVELQNFLSYPHDTIPDVENKINEKLFYIQETFGHDVLNKGIEIYKMDKDSNAIYSTLSLQERVNLRQEILNNPELSEQLNNLRYDPEKTKTLTGKIAILSAVYSNMIQESKSNEYETSNENSNELEQ